MSGDQKEQKSDVITFFDLLNILLKRKFLIVVITFICVLVAYANAVTTTPVYLTSASVDLGKVGMLPSRDDVKTGFAVQSVVIVEPYILAQDLSRNDVSVSGSRSGRLKFSRVGTDPEKDVEMVNKRIHAFFPKHEEYYKDLISLSKKYIKEVRSQIETTEKQLAKLNVLETKARQGNIQFITERRLLEIRKTNLQKELIEMKVLLKGGREPTITKLASTADLPIRPRTNHMLMLATVLGVIIGILTAFFLEFMAYFRAIKPA